MRLKASEQGLDRIRQARKEKKWDWNTDYAETPLVEASQLLDREWQPGEDYPKGISGVTWRRFLEGKNRIEALAFKAFCEALGLNWQEVVDTTSNNQLDQRAEKTGFIENFWVGRKAAIAHLSVKLRGDTRVLVLTGITGIGKTALAYQLAKVLQKDFQRSRPLNFEDDGARYFTSVAADLLIQWGETVRADDRKDPERLLYRLLRQLQNNRYLVQMDSVEMLLDGDKDTGWNNFQEQYQGEWWVRFFEQLLALPECQSRLILTSQDLPTEFQELGHVEYRHFETLAGLEAPERLQLFWKTGIEIEPISPSRPYLERIGAAYEGHPLALLVIAGEIISEPFNRDVVAYWKKYGHEIEKIEKARQQEEELSENDLLRIEKFSPRLGELVKKKIEASFVRLKEDFPDAYILLCFGAAYRRSVPKEAWFSGLKKRLAYAEEKLLVALDALGDRYLFEVEEFIEGEELLRQHNLIRSVALNHSKKEKRRI
ncbi:ATP-binding protein [Microcoleus sp. S36b_A4]|uniref:ATP-binding protein n=1 Tax=Microcoleus sp. S36b_A4 TaxID=3055420 RepID=UPI002FD58CF1